MLGQPRVSGDATRPTSSRPRPIPGPRADVRAPRQGTSTDHAVSPRPHGPSGAIGQELMTRTTAGREHRNPARQRGLLGLSGRLSHSPGGLRLCVSSRAPSRAGRSPYHSEPSIEEPDSTTTSRRIFGETPAITHHPHHQAIPGCASRPAIPSGARTYRGDCSWGLAERSGEGVSESVEDGVIAAVMATYPSHR